MRRLLALASLASLAAGCGDADPAPRATVLEVSPDSLDPADDAADDLTIRVEYRDADGDLGGGIAEVHDCRSSDLTALFDLPAIASDEAVEAGVPIEGVLEIVLADVGGAPPDMALAPACADLGVEDVVAGQAVFCLALTDAAGNLGPGDCTGAVAIAE